MGRSLVVLLGITLLAAQAQADDWKQADPENAGLDAQAINTLLDELHDDRRLRGLHSLLIVRRGQLVVEEYFDGWQANELHTLQSVSKSFTSALVGIAIERGDFKGVDESVLGFFPEDLEIQNLDDRKKSIRLFDLLTMQSGTDYHERGSNSPHSQLNLLARGWDRFYLDRPMETEPGTTFKYDSGAVILTSSLLKQRTGMHAHEYAGEYLFKPLGIESSRWYKNADGHPHTGGGLDLTPRDMAKFGLLYLRQGRWNGQQVVPKSWVRISTKAHVSFEGPNKREHEAGYGYWWWILEPDPAGNGKTPIYAALGFRGQHIFVVPEHDLVVVTTAGISGPTMHEPINLLYTHILPAISKPSNFKLIDEPMVGSADYLNARDAMANHLPKKLGVLRQRLVTIDVEAVLGFLDAAKESKDLSGEYEIDFFQDASCRYSRMSSVEEILPGYWLMFTSCNNYYGYNRLILAIWPEEQRIISEWTIGSQEYWMHAITSNYGVALQIDPQSRRGKPDG